MGVPYNTSERAVISLLKWGQITGDILTVHAYKGTCCAELGDTNPTSAHRYRKDVQSKHGHPHTNNILYVQ